MKRLPYNMTEWMSADTLVTILIPADKILVKSLTLPTTAAANLREILRFEMDKQTPFSADQVWYDWQVTGRDSENGKLHIRLWVCLKEVVQPTLALLRELDLQPHTARPQQLDDNVSVNLLPEKHRPSRNGTHRNTRTRIISALTLVLFLAALYLPLWKQEAVLAEMESRVSELRDQAVKVQQLLAEREGIVSRTRFLDELRQSRVATLDIIHELTRILPDDTSLTRLMLRNNELQIYGESGTATSVIQQIESSDQFSSVQFKAPVVKNSATGKDRFQLSAKIETPGETP